MKDFEIVMENLLCKNSLFRCKTCLSYFQFPTKDKYQHTAVVTCACGEYMNPLERFDVVKPKDGYNIRSVWEIEDEPSFQLAATTLEKLEDELSNKE